jgi:hypothetical protein
MHHGQRAGDANRELVVPGPERAAPRLVGPRVHHRDGQPPGRGLGGQRQPGGAGAGDQQVGHAPRRCTTSPTAKVRR